MNWLKDNPLGVALLALNGGLLLLVLAMALVWALPVTVDLPVVESAEDAGGRKPVAARPLADLGQFQVINEKPVFNESRQPAPAGAEDGAVADVEIEVRDAPKVRLTGVIITPAVKIASLTPADARLKGVMAREGQPLTGEFAGWQVSTVNPRDVLLESSDGQKLQLGLEVHDAKIKEPPRPEPQPRAALAEPAAAGQPPAEDGQALSRAEQIRQRIAERREELRLEQEAQQAQQESRNRAVGQAARKDGYQNAIRALMQKNRKDNNGDENDDG